MKIFWLGHSSFRIEAADQILLIDPWLRGNPSFDESRFDEAVKGVTHILVSHGHDDHAANAAEISRATGAPVAGIYDWVTWVTQTEKIEGIGFNKGGTIHLGDVAVTMVNAVHSASTMVDGRPVYTGHESGFMIAAEGHVIYFMGDTDVMADMGVFAELHQPDIGIVPIGGHFTMDPPRAAWACRKFFKFKTIIPCHYRTFPILAQSAAEMDVPGAKIVETEVLEAITI
ncbi:metal-dependent hydrolase [Pikeienuella sp. HZG-20]|uniref:metal-dependent hydrolase n=1 Tax=Paludibacillus litoralis TaxID=3133267 RepID=UPI0030EC0301